MGRKKYKK